MAVTDNDVSNLTNWPDESTSVTVQCKAFAALPLGLYSLLVCEDGTVLVWDESTGHYTGCHELSDSSQADIVTRVLTARAGGHNAV